MPKTLNIGGNPYEEFAKEIFQEENDWTEEANQLDIPQHERPAFFKHMNKLAQHMSEWDDEHPGCSYKWMH